MEPHDDTPPTDITPVSETPVGDTTDGSQSYGGIESANTIRAAVFGIQDGIVSNFGLIMGVSGAQFAPEAVLMAGIAGLASGAMSMAAGEYVSVQTQKELLAIGAEIDDDENVNPAKAAAANGGLFVAGGIVPLIPFMFTSGRTAVIVSIILSVLALYITGAVLTELTRQSAFRSGMRMLVIGGGAGVIGFLIGTVFGNLFGV